MSKTQHIELEQSLHSKGEPYPQWILHNRQSTRSFVKVQLEDEIFSLWTKWIYSLGCHWTLISPSLLKAEQYSINYCTEMDGLYEGFSAPPTSKSIPARSLQS